MEIRESHREFSLAISHMLTCVFPCHSLKSSHRLLSPLRPQSVLILCVTQCCSIDHISLLFSHVKCNLVFLQLRTYPQNLPRAAAFSPASGQSCFSCSLSCSSSPLPITAFLFHHSDGSWKFMSSMVPFSPLPLPYSPTSGLIQGKSGSSHSGHTHFDTALLTASEIPLANHS